MAIFFFFFLELFINLLNKNRIYEVDEGRVFDIYYRNIDHNNLPNKLFSVNNFINLKLAC